MSDYPDWSVDQMSENFTRGAIFNDRITSIQFGPSFFKKSHPESSS
jgi:hypothetical protein